MSDLRWQWVKCTDCGKEYRCTPNSDYFGLGGKPAAANEGRCWDCHLIANGMPPQPEPQLGDEEYR